MNRLRKTENKILFIGNSLTYYNKMPQMLQRMFDLSNINVKVVQSTYPGVSLKQHLGYKMTYTIDSMCISKPLSPNDTSETVKLLLNEKWKYIIIQEGTIPYLIPEARLLNIIPNILEIKGRVADKTTNWLLFKTWVIKADSFPQKYCYPSRKIHAAIVKEKCCSSEINSLSEENKILLEAFNEVCEKAQIKAPPVTECFFDIIQNYPKVNLYEDDSHPSKYGAYLNACVFYCTISGRKASSIKFYLENNMETSILIQEIVDKYF
jgi:hypothetical protein